MVISFTSVLAMILLIAALSLALGSALGVIYHEHAGGRPRMPHDMAPHRSASTVAELPRAASDVAPRDEPNATEATQAATRKAEAASEPLDAPKASRPWRELLQETQEANAFSQAVVKVYELGVEKYCKRFTILEEQLARDASSSNAEELQAIATEMTAINDAWMNEHAAADESLFNSRAEGKGYERIAGGLEEAMLNLASQIETTASNLSSLDIVADPESSCKRLLHEVHGLIACAHPMRDRSSDCLAAVMHATISLQDVDESDRRDETTGALNRWTLEAILQEWCQQKKARSQRATVAFVDIDQFAMVNEQVGMSGGNRILRRYCRLLEELVDGHDVPVQVSRFTGAQFALFFADTGARSTISCVERIRQTIEVTTFECAGTQLKFSVSCAATELEEKDTVNKFIRRLQKTLHSAKERGRNCSCVDEGEGATLCDPPSYPIEANVVSV